MPKLEKVSPWPFVGMGGMACAFFLNVGSGLAGVVPWWGVLLLLGKWLLLLLVAIRLWTPRPKAVVVVAVIDVALWLAIILAGAVWLGWAD